MAKNDVTNEQEEQLLEEELKKYRKESERVRAIINKVNIENEQENKIINIMFFLLIIIVLIAGILLKRLNLTNFLLTIVIIGMFKIMWMIHIEKKNNHFHFWILSTLEFKINEIDKKIKKLLESKKDD